MTLEQAQASLANYEAALNAVSRNQSYEIEGRQLRRADLAEIRNTIDWLERKISRLSSAASGKSSVYYVG